MLGSRGGKWVLRRGSLICCHLERNHSRGVRPIRRLAVAFIRVQGQRLHQPLLTKRGGWPLGRPPDVVVPPRQCKA